LFLKRLIAASANQAMRKQKGLARSAKTGLKPPPNRDHVSNPALSEALDSRLG
jgi:hypothetical protein